MTTSTMESTWFSSSEAESGYTEAMQPYFAAADRLGYSQDELVASMHPIRTERAEAIVRVDGEEMESSRHQVGFDGDPARSRGGLEISEAARSGKIMTKTVGMGGKHRSLGTKDIGGKSGLRVTAKQWEDMGDAGRDEAIRQHTLAHGYGPDNVTAMDIRSGPRQMDVIAETSYAQYGELAGMLASGVSEKWGGRPDLHVPRTGLGAAIVLRKYLAAHAAAGNQRYIEALNGGEPIPMIVQGLGKASLGLVQNIPRGVALMGAMEWNGAVVSDKPLDFQEVIAESRSNGLNEVAAKALGTQWIEPGYDGLRKFWVHGRGGIIVPAYDKNQITHQDADALQHSGTVIHSVANRPVPHKVQVRLPGLGIQENGSEVTSDGGTLSSNIMAEKWLDNTWTEERYEQQWTAGMERMAETIFAQLITLQAERDTLVPVSEVSDAMVVERSIERFRAFRAAA